MVLFPVSMVLKSCSMAEHSAC